MFKKYISQGSPGNRTKRIHTYIQREIYFKNLAHTIVGASKSEIYTAGLQAGNSYKSCIAIVDPNSAGQRLETQAGFPCCHLESEFPLLQKTSVLALKAFN